MRDAENSEGVSQESGIMLSASAGAESEAEIADSI